MGRRGEKSSFPLGNYECSSPFQNTFLKTRAYYLEPTSPSKLSLERSRFHARSEELLSQTRYLAIPLQDSPNSIDESNSIPLVGEYPRSRAKRRRNDRWFAFPSGPSPKSPVVAAKSIHLETLEKRGGIAFSPAKKKVSVNSCS